MQKLNKNFRFIFASFLFIFCFPTFVLAETIDADGDKLSDELEAIYHTDPKSPDTDGDGYTDYREIYHGYSPHDPKRVKMSSRDEDDDELSDAVEFKLKTDFRVADTDRDGHSDFEEVMSGFSPFSTSTEATLSRKIVVDKTIQQMYVEVDGGVRVKTYPVSTGNPWTPTPNGTFTMMKKVPVKRYVGVGYDLPNTKWNILFKEGGYYIHGAYWHNDFGKSTHSHGCINMRTEDAEVVYAYFNEGDMVEVIGETPKKRKVGT